MKSQKRILTNSVAVLLGAISANAATLYWDGDGTGATGNPPTAGVGGAGTWDTTLARWWNGTAYQLWNGVGGQDIADFRGTGSVAVTVGNVNVNRMQFSTNTLTFNTGTINFTGTPGIIDFNNTNGHIFNALLTGSVKIQATGNTGNIGTAATATINGSNAGLTATELSLAADSNSFIINNAAAFGNAGATVKLTKGVLNLGNNAAPNNNVPVSYNAWTTDLAGGTIRARFSTSTWNGATSLSANSGLTTRAAAGVSLVFASTATINLGASTLTFDSDSTSAGITINSVISGTGNIKTDTLALTGGGNGAGLTTLSAANTFSGTATTFANRGTLALNNVDALQNATLDTGASAGSQAVTFTVAGTNTYNIGALAGSDALAIGGNTISVGTKNVNTTFSADISGTGGGLTKVGNGSLTLTAATSFTGATTINSGTVALTASGSLSGSSGITLNGASAKLVASGTTEVSPIVTLTQGTLTGSGIVTTVNVGSGTGGVISNNDGTPGASLSIGSLTLTGGAALNLLSSTTAAPLVVSSLTNNSSANAVTITVGNPGGWMNGTTYDIVGYSTLGGSGGNNFARIVNNLSARQSGTWGDSGTALTLAITGDNPFWTGAANGNWNAADVNWKLVSANTNTTFLSTDDVLFNDNAAGSTTVNINTADVATNTTVFNNSTLNYTLTSSGGFGISAGSLAKNGSGSLTINNANSYTGGTTLNAGFIKVGHPSALGATASTFTLNGGTLDNSSGSALTTSNYPLNINGDFTFGGTNSLNLGTGTGTLGSAVGTSRTITVNANTLTIGGSIGNGTTANSIIKTGNGTLALSGSNNFTGAATINAGVLRAEANAGALGAGTLVLAGGELQLAGDPPLVFGRNTTVTANSQITSDTVTAAPGVTHTLGTLGIGANTLTIARGANATGNTAAVAFGTTTFTGAPTFSIGANSSLVLGNVNSGSDTATITGAGSFRSANAWAGAGGITLDTTFTGTATFAGANTFTGVVSINGGTLIAQSNTSLGSNTVGTTINSGGTLDLGGTLAANALNLSTEVITVSGSGVGGNGAIVNNGSNDQINATGRIVLAADSTFGGTKRWDLRSSTPTLDMAGFTITKVGTNQVSLVGAAVSNPGNIIINGGIFGVETTSNLGGSDLNSVTANTGATFQLYGNTNPVAWTVNLNDATLAQANTNATVSGPLTLAGANTIGVTGTSLTLSGAIGGSGGFNKTGAGVLISTNANTYTGATTVTAGMLRISSADGLGTAAAGTTVLAGGSLQVTGGITPNPSENITISGGGSDFFGALQAGAGGATWAGGITLGDATTRIGASAGNTLSISGSITDGVGTGFSVSGATGTGVVVLNPATANTYTGTTGVLRGILRLGKTDALPTATVLDVDTVGGVADAAQFDLAGFNQTVAALQDTATTNVNGVVSNSATATTSLLTVNGSQITEFNGVIQNGAGTVALTKDGTGSLRLSGVNTYTGPTNVDGGTLTVTGSISGSSVTVTDGGTLGGTGTTGAVTSTTGATISPGLSPGILNIGNLTMGSGSTLSIEINGLNVGTEYDQLGVTGSVDITGATLLLSGTYLTSPAIANDLFTILLNDGTSDAVTGTFAGLPEGALFTNIGGQDFTISYVGGDGNDIVLTAVPEPGSAALLLGGVGVFAGIRRRRRA